MKGLLTRRRLLTLLPLPLVVVVAMGTWWALTATAPHHLQASLAPPTPSPSADPTLEQLLPLLPSLLPATPPPAVAATPGASPSPHPLGHCQGSLCHQIPDTLVIPEINVDAFIEQLGLASDGDADVPKAWQDAGWFDPGYYPGTPGNAVILGHLDTDDPANRQGVFWNLHLLHAGSRVQVIRGDGSVLSFVVTSVATYPVQGFPLTTVFGPADHPVLRLLTCAGRFIRGGPGYDSRTVVTAELA